MASKWRDAFKKKYGESEMRSEARKMPADEAKKKAKKPAKKK